MKFRRIKAAAILVLFLTAGVLYSANRSQDVFLYDYGFQAAEETGETADSGKTEKPEDRSLAFEETDSGKAGESAGFHETETAKQVYVHVCGAVQKAGVYLISEDSIVADAIEAAGGMSEGAAADYLNLAVTISEGDKIYVPYLEDLEDPYGAAGQSSSGSGAQFGQGEDSGQSTLVNINTADSTQLMTLSGIGQTRAEAIIAYREANGNFQKIEEIMEVSGIKEGAFNKIKDQITV